MPADGPCACVFVCAQRAYEDSAQDLIVFRMAGGTQTKVMVEMERRAGFHDQIRVTKTNTNPTGYGASAEQPIDYSLFDFDPTGIFTGGKSDSGAWAIARARALVYCPAGCALTPLAGSLCAGWISLETCGRMLDDRYGMNVTAQAPIASTKLYYIPEVHAAPSPLGPHAGASLLAHACSSHLFPSRAPLPPTHSRLLAVCSRCRQPGTWRRG